MFLRSKSVKNVFHVGKRGKGCSKKDNPEQCNLAKNKLKQCFEDNQIKSGSLATNWKRYPFTGAITLERAQFTPNKPKHIFCAIKLI